MHGNSMAAKTANGPQRAVVQRVEVELDDDDGTTAVEDRHTARSPSGDASGAFVQ
jgi:hypothetical protein